MEFLFLLIFLPFSAAIYIYQNSCGVFRAKQIALGTSLFTFVLSSVLWVCFDGSTMEYQYSHFFFFKFLDISLPFGVDSLSLFFILLTTFTMPMCFLVGWQSVRKNIREYFIAFLLLEVFLLFVWMVTDLFLFYIFFESVLIPMFLVIGIWGSRARKIRAAYQFFLYTLAGSVCMLLGVLFLYFQAGSTDIHILLSSSLTEKRQLLLWLSFFASFAVKIPMIPFHLWLPEAHVEAPTAGSVLLAGILLKLGGYGFLRFSIPLFPEAGFYFTPFVYTLSLCGILYSSFTTLRQIDLKKIIAYSSVAHMNYVTIGLFTWNMLGMAGSYLLMISHGLVSPALFLLVGFLYDRHKTRLLRYYAGCGRTMPIFALFFLFFTMANISIPGTSSFVGEFLILTGAFQNNTTIAIGAATGMVWGGAYALWLANRLLYGMPKMLYIRAFADLARREVALLFPYFLGTLWLGLYAEPFLSTNFASFLSNEPCSFFLFGSFGSCVRFSKKNFVRNFTSSQKKENRNWHDSMGLNKMLVPLYYETREGEDRIKHRVYLGEIFFTPIFYKHNLVSSDSIKQEAHGRFRALYGWFKSSMDYSRTFLDTTFYLYGRNGKDPFIRNGIDSFPKKEKTPDLHLHFTRAMHE